MIFRTLALLPLCAALAFAADAGERRFDCTVVAIHDDASLGCRLPGANKALRIQLNAVELPAAEPWRRRARKPWKTCCSANRRPSASKAATRTSASSARPG